MSYSNGGTLTLPSPTHVRSADVSSGLRSIRQTLSRSPSTFRFLTRSPSKSPRKATSPCPSSPKRATSQPQLFAAGQPPYTPSPLVPSLKLALRSSARSNKSAIARPTLSRRTSPKSPMKRVLSQASDSGNATPVSSQSSSSGQENSTSTSPVERKSFERLTRIPFSLDGSAPVNPALSRLGGDASSDSHMTTSTSSPLKRSDAIMNLDQASLGSPAAKRRSLHGSASFGHDFNVFDHGPTSSPQFEIHDDSNQGYELSTGPFSSDSAVSSFTSTPRRSSSLRKSTLQQRHGEKTSWGRRHAAQIALQLANQNSGSTEMSTPNPTKSRPRLSMDQFVAPMPRDSPFSSQGALPNPSLHTMAQPVHQPHPLSRTMTTSSSNSSIGDEAPTHIPVNFGSNPRRPKIDFAKSLPPGATRPFPFDGGSDESGSFATPHNFRNAKPLPSAFASTGGLISKTNRNPEEPIVPRGQGNVNMPDTPCKKHGGVFATYPSPGSAIPGSALVKARHVRHSFGSPSTPHGNQAVPGSFGHGVSVFGSAFGQRGPNRRGSFLSIDGDESGGSPDAKDESQSLADFDLPPTPTKQAFPMSGFPHQLYTSNNSNNRRSLQLQLPTSTGGFGLLKQPHRTSSKLNLSESFAEENEEDSDDASMDLSESPTTSNSRIHVRPSTSDPSFGRSRATKDPHSTLSSPLANSLTTPFLSPSSKPGFTKPSHVAPASPLERIGFFESFAPHTPQDSVTPPDPSGLSISNPKETQATRSGVNNAFMLPPATPTAGRDQFSKKRQSTTPVGSTVTSEIDLSLISRFEKVELFGTGQFSSVYKVTKPAPNFYQFGGTPSQSRTPPTPIPEQVFAVKKSRQPFQGTKDRLRKLQEVNVLKALGGCRHVVHYLDSWEEKNHLYIQTEYCEEGSLEMFLGENGRKGRLDDFRIWKIMLEIGLGLKYIHDSGYLHLDLKPANIFIDFHGFLKIGDFGMATSWPAPAGIEGEGDREYIGPEILEGRYDKPADVFALGLIILEIAGNVQLPDNGPTWQRLRSGDMTDVPSLTWSDASSVERDAEGMPVGDSDISMENYDSDEELEAKFGSPSMTSRKRNIRSMSHDPGNLFGSIRRGELNHAPDFMRNVNHKHALDGLVKWMLQPSPTDRPLIHQVIEAPGLQWVAARGRAGATVYEGNWGPADEILADDAEMMDV